MKVGNLVESTHGFPTCPEGSLGIIIDIDPLRRETGKGNFTAANEIVVMLDNGEMWHASPSAWKVKNENH